MNRQEIQQWITEAEYITSSACDYDGRGNRHEIKIYEKDGQFYSVSFYNRELTPAYGKKGLEMERDENGEPLKDERGRTKYIYPEPKPVKKITKMVEVTEYVTI